MADKGEMGFPTKASAAQKKYEEALAKVNKDKIDWQETREYLDPFIKECDDLFAKNRGPLVGPTILLLKHILNSQGMITDLGLGMCDVNTRLVELEKTVRTLSLKIR
ncbi:MAG: hypothetical protein ABSG90_09895 [Dehalococcoidia bacterium]|jgi:hypothetical protein